VVGRFGVEYRKQRREAKFARSFNSKPRLPPVSLGQMDILSYTRGNFWDIGKRNRAKNGTKRADNARKRALLTGVYTVTVLKTLMFPVFLRFSLDVRVEKPPASKNKDWGRTAERPCYNKDLPMSRRSQGSRGTGD